MNIKLLGDDAARLAEDYGSCYASRDPMKAYVITTGVIFGLITVAHIWRVFAENPRLATDPFFILLTVLAAGLCVWAWSLIRLSSRP